MPVQPFGHVNNPGVVHDRGENVDQLGRHVDHVQRRTACPTVSSIVNNHGDTGTGVVRHHLVKLLVFQLLIAVVTGHNDNRV